MEVEIKRDGLILKGVLHVPQDKKNYDLLLLFEGLRGDHTHATVSGIAQVVEKQGFATFNFDFESRGQSEGKFADMTLLGQILDAAAALKYVRSLPGVRKIYVVGHSTGGLVAPLLAGYFHDQISGLILVSPALTAVKEAREGQIFGQEFDPVHVPEKISLPTTNNVSHIKYNEEFDLNGFYIRQLQSLPMYQIAKLFTGPVLLLHAENDEEVSPQASYWFRGLFENSKLYFIKGATHGFKEPGVAVDAGKYVAQFMSAHH